ncbi:hypothetical protein TNCV_2288421 [Trichonephila clavipes]|nr:hypothetical protein TNCV_2288421 [Trichonephila clavipes]
MAPFQGVLKSNGGMKKHKSSFNGLGGGLKSGPCLVNINSSKKEYRSRFMTYVSSLLVIKRDTPKGSSCIVLDSGWALSRSRSNSQLPRHFGVIAFTKTL